MISNLYIEPFYLFVFSIVIILIAYLFWFVNKDLKKLSDYIKWQQEKIETHAHSIGELQRQVQRIIFAQKEKEE